jgi:hypothetical protein
VRLVAVSLVTITRPSPSALAFHLQIQNATISETTKGVQVMDYYLNNTRQTLQNGNITGHTFSLDQAEKQSSFYPSSAFFYILLSLHYSLY